MQHSFRSWKADGQVEIDLVVQRNLSIHRGKSQQASQFALYHPRKTQELWTSVTRQFYVSYSFHNLYEDLLSYICNLYVLLSTKQNINQPCSLSLYKMDHVFPVSNSMSSFHLRHQEKHH